MNHALRALVVALAIGSFALPACSNDDIAEPTIEQFGDTGSGELPARPTEFVACDLLKEDDINAVYEVVAGPEQVELSPSDECRTTVDSEIDGYVSVSLYTEDEAIALGPTLYPGSTPVEGIAAEAWYVHDLKLIQARLADGRVVSIQDLEGATDEAQMTAWLESAVGRI